ncbi:MAG: hypothetical protein C3F06_12640 [Candidatus Methanoperedenaceae archaeon]|nr:MAG: hypothetical protein C3F06_12640 [Candidatus Methanoperedenaceae archaeon]
MEDLKSITSSIMITLREIIGFFLPGFLWLLAIALNFSDQIKTVLANFLTIAPLSATSADLFLWLVIISTSYFIGTVNIHISFKTLDVIGGIIDKMVVKIIHLSKMANMVIKFLSERFHISSLVTLEDELEKSNMEQLKEKFNISQFRDWEEIVESYRIYVELKSPVISSGASKQEAELNFFAGMFLPLLMLSFFWFQGYPEIRLFLLFSAIYFALRFQHLRKLFL